MQESLLVGWFILLCFFLACRSCVFARFWSLDRYAAGMVIEKTRITPSDYASFMQYADVSNGCVCMPISGVVSIRLSDGKEDLFLVEAEECWNAMKENTEISFHYYKFFSMPIIIELDVNCKNAVGDFPDLSLVRA